MIIARVFTAIVLVIVSCTILYLVATSVHGMVYRAKPQSVVRMGLTTPATALPASTLPWLLPSGSKSEFPGA